ncbi:hypothetical protein [Macrococcoides caseolyticum]|uniref:hypothetical protein n=1 Tax=Macrococcoides caseolyticum TaxID=69966 RepID=UPI001F481C4A|nr:hypothetical protein [Macrococcus caseolyticus]MCE4957685.1 hypothetical protein [Macrococcus caseolyticus]
MFIGFADAKHKFPEVSGISFADLRDEVYKDEGFQQFIYRFGRGRKRYIKVQPAIEYIEKNILKKETDL